MRKEIPWWTGAAALGWFSAIVAQSLLNKLSEVDVAEPVAAPDYLRAIADHRVAFTAEVVAGALAIAFALVTVVGLLSALKDTDYFEPAGIGAAFFVVGATVLVVAFTMYGNLVGTAMEYAKGSYASANVVVQEGDVQGDQFQIIYFAGQVILSFGMAVLGLVLDRAGYVRTLFGVVAVLLLPLSLLMYHLGPEFMLARVAWLTLLAWRAFEGPEEVVSLANAEA